MIAASLALLLIYTAKVEAVDNILNDVDFKTLIFLICMFFLVEAVTKTGLSRASQQIYNSLGTELVGVAIVMLLGIAAASSLLANTPVVAASILLIKGYMVIAELVSEAGIGSPHSAPGPSYVAGIRCDDVRCDAGRECHAHRRVRQHRVRGHLRASWQGDHIRDIPTLWSAHHRDSLAGVGAVCSRVVSVDE